MGRRSRLVLLVGILLAAAGSLLLWNPATLLADGAPGLWRLPVALAVYALGTLAFVPKPALSAAVGLLLGAALGLPVAVAGTTLGAAVAFGLGRGLGREALRPLVRGRLLTSLDRRLSDQGFRSVLLLRLIPGVPFQAANYAAAVSGVRLGPFLAATALGVVPGTAAYVVAGASADSPGSPAFLLSTGVIVLLGVGSLLSLRRGNGKSLAPAAAMAQHGGYDDAPGGEAADR